MNSKVYTFSKKLLDKTLAMRNRPEEIGIIYIYRYTSLFVTSMFYLMGEPSSPLVFKMGVIISLFAAAKMITELYIKCRDYPRILKTIILIETLGITFLLFPTGGLESPFIWYALNPVLVAASFLASYFCWANLFFYILSASAIPLLYFGNRPTVMAEQLKKNSYMILVFILITLAVQLLSSLTKKLHSQASVLQNQSNKLFEMNRELQEVNERYKESLGHIMSLYQIVEAYSVKGSKGNLIQTISDYATRLTKAEASFFWMCTNKNCNSSIVLNSIKLENNKYEFQTCIENMWDEVKSLSVPVIMRILDSDFLIAVVKSHSKFYGVLGVEYKEQSPSGIEDQHIKLLTFLSELSSIMLEQYDLEEVANSLLIVEEQNRIANEMHDSVSQRLFSLVCAVHAIAAKSRNHESKELGDHLKLIRESANGAMLELRSCIYRLSSKKKGEKALFAKIKMYLAELADLNGISITDCIEGDEEILSGPLKRALYRIICEATGNAVRHGGCSNIDIKLSLHSTYTELYIKDNGNGFILENLEQRNGTGLGIYNIKNLVQTFNGRFQINSESCKGTTIFISIPNERSFKANSVEHGGLAI